MNAYGDIIKNAQHHDITTSRHYRCLPRLTVW